jgi:hypothetical protein
MNPPTREWWPRRICWRNNEEFLFSKIVRTFRLDVESRRGCLLLPLGHCGGYYDENAVSVAPVNFSGLSSQKYVDNRMPSSGYRLKSRCQIHGRRIDEHQKCDGIGIVIWKNLRIAGVSECSVGWHNVIRGDSRGFRVGLLGRRTQVHLFVHAEVNVVRFRSLWIFLSWNSLFIFSCHFLLSFSSRSRHFHHCEVSSSESKWVCHFDAKNRQVDPWISHRRAGIKEAKPMRKRSESENRPKNVTAIREITEY